MHRSEITLDLAAIRHNTQYVTKIVDGAELWAVLKADAYGHGAIPAAKAVLEGGAQALCVATLEEGLTLRTKFPQARVIILGPISPQTIPVAHDARLECVAYDSASLKALSNSVRFHIKINLGLNRYGFEDIPTELTREPTGVFGQFSHAHADLNITARQLERFLDICSMVPNVTRHVCNSSAALRIPEAHLDAVRSGSALLGLSLIDDQSVRIHLKPALRWVSYIAQVRNLPQGASVGYEASYRAASPMVMGVVPVGYGDGFSARLSGTTVLVGEERVRVIGSVSMDAITVALPKRVPTGTPVVIVGDDLPFETHVRFAGMANWELCTGLSSDPRRVQRRIINENV
ncbi:alanine racemase [Streptomyces sp. NPDC048254]|uniref:alanine racemase n=1 Tax=Streptomyces sp. NPDC048254 TaxID=3365525 RepID=UPI003720E8A0